VHAAHGGSLQHLGVGNLILPLDLEDVSQTPHVEAVEFLHVPCVCGPRLAAIEESAEHAGLVDAQSGRLSEAGVVPHSIQKTKFCVCVFFSCARLCVCVLLLLLSLLFFILLLFKKNNLAFYAFRRAMRVCGRRQQKLCSPTKMITSPS
jgi:hypothetical protein